MATGFTFNASYNGATAAADGDTYVTFTENITFESAPVGTLVTNFPASVTDQVVQGGTPGVDNSVEGAQSFLSDATASTLQQVRVALRKTNSPTDNLIFEVQTDSAGVPSGTVVGTVATIAGTTLTTSEANYTYSCSIALSASTTYWIVARRSGARDTTNYYSWRKTTSDSYANGAVFTRGSLGWISATGDALFEVSMLLNSQVLYLTDTASDVATASVDREAWTSRGAGVQTDVTNTAAGWTAPIQVTDTAGGTVVDWFTKQLTAFTLTGMAVVNIRALESNASAGASLRCEIARVESDGTSPTVWASWCIAPTINHPVDDLRGCLELQRLG